MVSTHIPALSAAADAVSNPESGPAEDYEAWAQALIAASGYNSEADVLTGRMREAGLNIKRRPDGIDNQSRIDISSGALRTSTSFRVATGRLASQSPPALGYPVSRRVTTSDMGIASIGSPDLSSAVSDPGTAYHRALGRHHGFRKSLSWGVSNRLRSVARGSLSEFCRYSAADCPAAHAVRLLSEHLGEWSDSDCATYDAWLSEIDVMARGLRQSVLSAVADRNALPAALAAADRLESMLRGHKEVFHTGFGNVKVESLSFGSSRFIGTEAAAAVRAASLASRLPRIDLYSMSPSQLDRISDSLDLRPELSAGLGFPAKSDGSELVSP